MNEKNNNNNNQSKSLNLNSYNVRYIYIVYILYSKANNNIYFHKSKDKRNPEKVWSILILQTETGVLDFFQSRVKTITSVERKLLIGRQYSERYIDWFANFNE
jgi:hypothetical protein